VKKLDVSFCQKKKEKTPDNNRGGPLEKTTGAAQQSKRDKRGESVRMV